MSGLSRACALVALAGTGACLDVPPYRPCGVTDRDCDGWVSGPGRAEVLDCDDDNAAVNPSQVDDPATVAVEDCFADGLTTTLAPVAPLARGWTVGDLALEFDSTSRMPSSLRRGSAELLGTNADSCVRDERAAGVSLYPAFGVDDQSVQVGQATTIVGGPALATTEVVWSQTLLAPATVQGCDAPTMVTGTIDFTVQPNGRIVRHDRVAVSAGVTTCAGCADPGGTAPLLTSYWTFGSMLDRYEVSPSTTSAPFPAAGMAANLAAPGAPVTGCVTGAGAAMPQVGLAWWFPTPIAGMRARTTNDSRANRALVVDWIDGSAVAAGTYQLISAVATELDGTPGCSSALRTAMAEFARPPTLTPTSFIPERGVYRYTGPEGAGITIAASQGVEGGAVLEVPRVSGNGVTVWRGTGGRYVRLRRGQDYLIQFEPTPDGPTAVLYVPTIPASGSIVIAGPGGEPP